VTSRQCWVTRTRGPECLILQLRQSSLCPIIIAMIQMRHDPNGRICSCSRYHLCKAHSQRASLGSDQFRFFEFLLRQ